MSGCFNFWMGQNLAVAFTNRGLAYKRKGHVDEAIADFSEAIRLKPDFVFAFNNRGNAYYYKGQFDRAIADFSEAIRLKPDLSEAFGNRGNVYRKKGQFDRAIKDYDAAMMRGSIQATPYSGTRPRLAKALENRALVLAKRMSA